LRIEGPKKKRGPEMTIDSPLIEGTRMRHMIHRHEPAVPSVEIEIIDWNDDHVVVNKPSGMPVHAGGQYRKNTVHAIVEAEHNEFGKISPVHRLDKPVSGVLIFSRHKAAADRIRSAMVSGETQKVYVARVLGKFEHDREVDAPLYFDYDLSKAVIGDPEKDEVYVEEEDGQDAEAPRKKIRRTKEQRIKDWNEAVAKDKKKSARIFRPSKTIVKLLEHSKDGKTSLVECQPITGRTHQIRAHLGHIGYPIANDTVYGGTYGSSNDASIEKMRSGCERPPGYNSIAPKELQDPLCPNCPRYVVSDFDPDLKPIWLHAWKYSVCGKTYVASYPIWAKDGFSSQ